MPGANSQRGRASLWAPTNGGLAGRNLFGAILALGVCAGVGSILAADGRMGLPGPQLVVVGIVAGLLIVILLARPLLTYGTMWICWFVLGPAFAIGVEVGEVRANITDFLAVVAICAVTLRQIREGRLGRVGPVTLLLVLPLVVFIIWSAVNNDQSAVLSDARLLLYGLASIWMLRLFLTCYGPTRIADLTFRLICVGSLLAACKGIALVLNPGDSVPLSILSQQVAVTASFDQLGSNRVTLFGADTLCVVAIPITTAWIAYRNPWQASCLPIIGMISAVVVLTLTFTRIDWIAAVGGSLFVLGLAWVADHPGSRSRILVLSLMGAALVVATGFVVLPSSEYSVQELAARRFSGDSSVGGPNNLDYRLEEGQSVLQAISTNPLFGKGLGGQIYFPRSPLVWISWVHSGWAWVLLHFGFLGFGGLLYLVLSGERALYGWAIGRCADRKSAEVAAGLAGGLLALSLMSLTNNRFASIEGIYFTFLCWLYVLSSREQRRSAYGQEGPERSVRSYGNADR